MIPPPVAGAGRAGSRGWQPALWLAAISAAVALVRPPLPLDETRYLEVFRESLRSNPLLLRLMGEPYAEKPPLLFWLGRVLSWLPIPDDLGLRLVPGLASALCVLFAARIGRRAGLALAGWTQAALLLAFLAGQYLLFDPLLSCCVWGAVAAWVARRDGWAWVGAAAALLAKGPVALLFLVGFSWSLQPLRGRRAGDGRRWPWILGTALGPLVAWALSAALLGGPEFARALLWDRWAGRMVHSFAHQREVWFYLPVLLGGALPGTWLLLRRDAPGARDWERRTLAVVGLLFLVFSAISGKQAHYLVPLAPALALLLAARIERRPDATAILRRTLRVELGLLVAAAAATPLALPLLRRQAGPAALEFLGSMGFWLLIALALGSAALALAACSPRRSAAELLAIGLLGIGGSLIPAHAVVGRVVFPHALARLLAGHPEPDLAIVGRAHYGVYHLLAAPRVPVRVPLAELERWRALHPGGWILAEDDVLAGATPDGMETRLQDVIHSVEVRVLVPAGF